MDRKTTNKPGKPSEPVDDTLNETDEPIPSGKPAPRPSPTGHVNPPGKSDPPVDHPPFGEG